MQDYRWFMGHLVTASGMVIGPHGVKNTKIMKVRRTLPDGTKQITGAIDKHELAIEFDGKMTYRSYGRFIYAAFHDDFDINDMNLVVVSTTDFRFEKNPYKYEVLTREEFFERKGIEGRSYKEDERQIIYETYEQIKGSMPVAVFAERLGVSSSYINLLIREMRDRGKDSN